MSVLLVGLDNPQSSDPRYALFPAPTGCSGDNLFRMMESVDRNFSRRQYVNVPKINLFPVGRAPTKAKREWRRAAAAVMLEQLRDTEKSVVLVGGDVRDAFSNLLDAGENWKPMTFALAHGCTWAWIPHPSGRNHWYNVRGRKKKVGRFVLETVNDRT